MSANSVPSTDDSNKDRMPDIREAVTRGAREYVRILEHGGTMVEARSESLVYVRRLLGMENDFLFAVMIWCWAVEKELG